MRSWSCEQRCHNWNHLWFLKTQARRAGQVPRHGKPQAFSHPNKPSQIRAEQDWPVLQHVYWPRTSVTASRDTNTLTVQKRSKTNPWGSTYFLSKKLAAWKVRQVRTCPRSTSHCQQGNGESRLSHLRLVCRNVHVTINWGTWPLQLMGRGSEERLAGWSLYTLRHGIQISMEAILACHPASSRSAEWLDCVTQNRVNNDVFAHDSPGLGAGAGPGLVPI